MHQKPFLMQFIYTKEYFNFLFYPECIKVASRLISCMPDQMIYPVLMPVQDRFSFETTTVTPEHKIQGTHFSNKNCEDNDVRKFKSSICGSYTNVWLARLAVTQSSSLHLRDKHLFFFFSFFPNLCAETSTQQRTETNLYSHSYFKVLLMDWVIPVCYQNVPFIKFEWTICHSAFFLT